VADDVDELDEVDDVDEVMGEGELAARVVRPADARVASAPTVGPAVLAGAMDDAPVAVAFSVGAMVRLASTSSARLASASRTCPCADDSCGSDEPRRRCCTTWVSSWASTRRCSSDPLGPPLGRCTTPSTVKASARMPLAASCTAVPVRAATVDMVAPVTCSTAARTSAGTCIVVGACAGSSGRVADEDASSEDDGDAGGDATIDDAGDVADEARRWTPVGTALDAPARADDAARCGASEEDGERGCSGACSGTEPAFAPSGVTTVCTGALATPRDAVR
jgi:hypothetical protein